MDELIVAFLNNSCTDEYKNEIYRSFKLCSDFEYHDIYSSFIDILTNESYVSSDTLKDSFDKEIHNKLNYILEQHSIVLINTASIFEKNEILSALYALQDLEDYNIIIAILESLDSDEEIMSSVLEQCCQLTQEELLPLIECVHPTILSLLKQFIYSKELVGVEVDTDIKKIIKTFKIFTKLYGINNIGSLLVTNDVLLGNDLSLYLSYVDGVKGNTVEQTALNVISLIYLTKQSIDSPIKVFNDHSFTMLEDLALVSKVEPLVINIVAKVNEYLKAYQQVAS